MYQEFNPLRDYLREIGRYPLLNGEQELQLAYRYRDGDDSARETLINSNLRLVVSIAKSYKNQKLSLMDMISAGNLGLITAVEKFNPDLGYRFSTCATPWIKQAILKSITDNGKTIRLPAHIFQLMNKYKKVIEELQQTGEEITDEKLAHLLKVSEDKIALLRQYKHDTISLDTPLTDEEDGDKLGDMIEDTTIESANELTEKMCAKEIISKAIKTLPERTQRILSIRFGLGKKGVDPDEYCEEHTLEQVGTYVHLTRERVRQIIQDALMTLKTYIKREE